MRAVRRLLLPTDGSEASLAAVRYGIALASALNAQVRVLRVLSLARGKHLADAEGTGRTGHMGHMGPSDIAFEQQLLTEIVRGFAKEPADVSVLVTEGLPADTILAMMQEVDLVVMGTRGRGGAAGLPFGSVTDRVVRRATRPVWVVHPYTVWRRPESITVAFDGGPAGDAALSLSLALARALQCSLRVVYVMEDLKKLLALVPEFGDQIPDMEDTLRTEATRVLRYASRRAHDAGVSASLQMVRGEIGPQILALSSDPGTLTLLGTQGTSALQQGHVGEICAFVMHHALHPYVVVPPARSIGRDVPEAGSDFPREYARQNAD